MVRYETSESFQEAFGLSMSPRDKYKGLQILDALAEARLLREPRLTCPVCSKVFLCNEALVDHARSAKNHESMRVCHICQRGYESRSAVVQHLQDCAKHNAGWECQLCDRSFSNERALGQHIIDAAVHKFSHSCSECQRIFTSASAPRHHEQSPGHTPRCKRCEGILRDIAALNQHHSNNPEY